MSNTPQPWTLRSGVEEDPRRKTDANIERLVAAEVARQVRVVSLRAPAPKSRAQAALESRWWVQPLVSVTLALVTALSVVGAAYVSRPEDPKAAEASAAAASVASAQRAYELQIGEWRKGVDVRNTEEDKRSDRRDKAICGLGGRLYWREDCDDPDVEAQPLGKSKAKRVQPRGE